MADFLIAPDDLVVLDTGCDRPIAFVRAWAGTFREALLARGFRLVRVGDVGKVDSLPPAQGSVGAGEAAGPQGLPGGEGA